MNWYLRIISRSVIISHSHIATLNLGSCYMCPCRVAQILNNAHILQFMSRKPENLTGKIIYTQEEQQIYVLHTARSTKQSFTLYDLCRPIGLVLQFIGTP